MKRFFRLFSPFFKDYFDDLLAVFGCVCILYGLSKWNEAITWVVGGLMLIGFAFMIGKTKVEEKNVNNRSS